MFYVDIITYLCELPDTLLVSYFSENVASIAFYGLAIFAAWSIAAEFHGYILKAFTKWCNKSRAKDYCYRSNWVQMKMMELKNELHSQPIALSCKYFIISNGLLASVSTYLIAQCIYMHNHYNL